jgi:hemerythrin-like domain-containing protein
MSNTDSRNEAYRELLEEHTKLRGLLSDLRVMLARRSGLMKEVVGKLQQLHDQVDVHFHAEELSDCFPELVSNAPRVSERVSVLLAEHGELRAEIHQIVQDAARRQGTEEDWDRLATVFQEFAAQLMSHEQVENELVQEVFTDDIGSKD